MNPSIFDDSYLQADEKSWLQAIGQGPASGLGIRLGRERQKAIQDKARLDHLEDVLRLNMVQQQAYYRLLGDIFLHHKECDTCVPSMQKILTIIGHNIEHLDALLPEEEKAKVIDKDDDNN